MKFAVLIGGGMADEALEALENRSPLEAANVPILDRIAAEGRTGLIQTVPPGVEPTSEYAVGNLLGLERLEHPFARGPLEALGIGLSLDDDVLALRFNLVHLFTDYQRLILADHTGGIESDEEASPFIEALDKNLGGEGFRFVHVGGYRGLLLWEGGPEHLELTPPYLLLGAEIGPAMPKGEGSRQLHHLYNNAQMVLGAHPVNQERRRTGRTTVNSIWAFGAGSRVPSVKSFAETWGLRAGMISKAASLRGLAMAAGMDVIEPASDKASPELLVDATLDYLRGGDLIFIHQDAGDSAAHRMNAKGKVAAIEKFDSLAEALLERLRPLGEYRLAVLSDHRTSALDGKHASAPVPIAICGTEIEKDRPKEYDERLLVRGSLRLTDGRAFLPNLLEVA